ncbi:ABC transporter ATP-binding protein [candidate division WOR-3 bacterium]|nr:ABC transporter ATP-binding protein [candidate division WOR-3 bacterium]
MFTKLKQMNEIMKGHRLPFFSSLICMSLASAFAFLTPLIIRHVIDFILGGSEAQIPFFLKKVFFFDGKSPLSKNLYFAGFLLVFSTLFQGIFTLLKGALSSRSSEGAIRDLRERLYNHIQHLPYSYHTGVKTGDLIQRCSSDVETIRRFYSVQFIEIGRALVMLCLVLPIMVNLNRVMTFYSMAIIPVIFGFAVFFFLKVKKAFKISDEAEGALSATLQENLTGIRIVRAFARQDFEISKFDRKNLEFRDLTYKLIQLLSFYWSASDFLCMAQIALITVIGSKMALSHELSIGTLVVFVTYEGLLLWPIRQMGRIITDMGKTFVSVERVNEILGVNTEYPISRDNRVIPDKELASDFEIKGDIELKGVWHYFHESEEPSLKNVSMKIRKGQTVALMGPTGSGKTSLVSLLPRLHEYSSGSILVDGRELKTIDYHHIRKNIGIVLQEPFLFSKTIKENLKMGKKKSSEEELRNASELSAVHDVIMSFEKGYETIVGERGVTLSGGQKQRIAISRTLLGDPPVLIFDDSFSSLDSETDQKIRAALKSRKGRRTTIIISHRISSISGADKIFVLENGEIKQEGTHEELIEEQGLYKRVWDIQSQFEKDVTLKTPSKEKEVAYE